MSQDITGPDDFSAQDWQELYEIKEQVDQTAQETGIPRRDILKGAGLLAAGSLAGGISAQQAIERFIQTAEADASTSDSDGNVGTPSDRVDVFADGLDSNSVSTEKQPRANVKAYGAVGDGVEDDTAAIQAAIDAQESAVYLPPGDYIIQSGLTVPADTTVVWDSRANILKDGAFDAITVNAADVTLKRPRIDGQGNDGHLVVADNADNLTVEGGYLRNTVITGSTSLGVLVLNSANVRVSEARISNTGATQGAVRFDNCRDARVSDCYIEDTRHHGISFIQTDSGVATGNTIYRNGWKDQTTTGVGIHSDGGDGLTWTGNTITDPYGAGWKTQTPNTSVLSNYVRRINSAEQAAGVVSATDATIVGNTLVTEQDTRGLRVLTSGVDATVMGNRVKCTVTSSSTGLEIAGDNTKYVFNDVSGFSSRQSDTATDTVPFNTVSKQFGSGEFADHRNTPRNGQRAFFAESVGQSAVELGRAGSTTSALYLVMGEDPDGNRFADVMLGTFSTVNVFASLTDGTIGRTYSVSSNILSGQFDSGSSDGDMQAFGWGV